MRKLKYLSPSSLSCWEKDHDEFYIKYLADNRPDRSPQEIYMSVGSAFDAYVKAELYYKLFGKKDPAFEFEALFESQVEEHNRDDALRDGEYLLQCYKFCGAYSELEEDLLASPEEPQFETTVQGEVNGVELLGKPDCLYHSPSGVKVILDWKVNGFYSSRSISPAKGYKLVRDCWEGKQSRTNGRNHKDYTPTMLKDVEHSKNPMEFTNKDWADQLATYAWLTGIEVGDGNFISRIDQLACGIGDPKKIRCAHHITKVSKDWQEFLAGRLKNCWEWSLNPYEGDEEKIDEMERIATAAIAFKDELTTMYMRDNQCRARVR